MADYSCIKVLSFFGLLKYVLDPNPNRGHTRVYGRQRNCKDARYWIFSPDIQNFSTATIYAHIFSTLLQRPSSLPCNGNNNVTPTIIVMAHCQMHTYHTFQNAHIHWAK